MSLRSSPRPAVVLTASLALLTLAGCAAGKKTYPVKGKFVWPNGTAAKELAGGTVNFQCDAEQVNSKGPIGEDGSFVLGTYQLDDGTVAGKHKVALVQPSADYGDNPPFRSCIAATRA